MNKFIVPTQFPTINMDAIRSLVRAGVKSSEEAEIAKIMRKAAKMDYQNKEWTSTELQLATDIVMDEIFKTYCGRKYRRKVRKYIPDETDPHPEERSNKTIIYTVERENCRLDVFLCSGSLLYLSQVTTLNYPEAYKAVCYYDERHMMRNDDVYLKSVLRDFSELVHECVKMKYCFEYTDDRPPRGVFMDSGAMFYEVHEKVMLTPKHYYAGMAQKPKVTYDKDNNWTIFDADEIKDKTQMPFELWFNELIACIK